LFVTFTLTGTTTPKLSAVTLTLAETKGMAEREGVRVHRGQIMRKMKANSLAELVRMADKLGVAEQNESHKSNKGSQS
jgi:Bacterial regulatory proteins, luxR family